MVRAPQGTQLFLSLLSICLLSTPGVCGQANSSPAPVSAPAPESPPDPRVLRVDDDNPRCDDEAGKPYCTVASAIRVANERPGADVIELAEGGIFPMTAPLVANPVDGATGLPLITSEIIIHGRGATIERVRANRTPDFRLFWIEPSGSLKMDNVLIRGGSTPFGMDGAGLWNQGTTRLERVTFSENVSGDDGGAIRNDGHIEIVSCTLSFNNAGGGGGGGVGGALYNVPIKGDGEALITGTSMFANRAGDHGGAIFNSSRLTMVNSTISGNIASHLGGAIRNVANAKFNNVTLYANQAGVAGGNISNLGSVVLSNSVVAGGASPVSPDCEEIVTSEGYILIQNQANCTIDGSEIGLLTGVDPMLTALQDLDGGLNKMHRPSSKSPIVDAASPAAPGSGGTACEALDQRGAQRPRDGNHDSIFRCDMGAAEIGGTELR